MADDKNPLEGLFSEGDEALIEMTTSHKKMFDAYVQAGFKEKHAIELVAAYVASYTSAVVMLNHDPGEEA